MTSALSCNTVAAPLAIRQRQNSGQAQGTTGQTPPPAQPQFQVPSYFLVVVMIQRTVGEAMFFYHTGMQIDMDGARQRLPSPARQSSIGPPPGPDNLLNARMQGGPGRPDGGRSSCGRAAFGVCSSRLIHFKDSKFP
jgi:hypothetical protein